MASARYLNTKQEFEDALTEAGSKPVFVKFTAKWCGPCKRIDPLYQDLAQSYANACFYEVDVDENDEVSEKYDVQSLPTFIIFKDGVKVERFKGADEEKLKTFVKQHAGSSSEN